MSLEQGPGIILVISGPEGSGKSVLARGLAKGEGSFIEIDARQLDVPTQRNDLLLNEPKTIIGDGVPKSEEARDWLRSIAANKKVIVTRKGKNDLVVSAPMFIFCVYHLNEVSTFAGCPSISLIDLTREQA